MNAESMVIEKTLKQQRDHGELIHHSDHQVQYCSGLYQSLHVYRSSYHLTPASNRCLVYATLVRTSFGINFRPFLNML